MTRAEATETAQRWANKYGRPFYVIWSVEDDPPGEHYHPTDEETMQTFYFGCGDPVAGPFEPPENWKPPANSGHRPRRR